MLRGMEKPTSTRPLPEAPTEPSDPALAHTRGASDATLIIFLVGVMLMLAVCVAFILVAS
jgi:hypothetical protein